MIIHSSCYWGLWVAIVCWAGLGYQYRNSFWLEL